MQRMPLSGTREWISGSNLYPHILKALRVYMNWNHLAADTSASTDGHVSSLRESMLMASRTSSSPIDDASNMFL